MAPSLDLFGLSGWEGCKSRTLRRPDQVKKNSWQRGGWRCSWLVLNLGLSLALLGWRRKGTNFSTYVRTVGPSSPDFSLVQNLWKCPAGQAVADSTMLGRQAAPRFALLHQEWWRPDRRYSILVDAQTVGTYDTTVSRRHASTRPGFRPLSAAPRVTMR